jgi:glutamyl-tRNA reductase
MLVSFGLDFLTAGVEVRERFPLDEAALARMGASLDGAGISESFGLSTCYRVEWYGWSDQPPESFQFLAAEAWGGTLARTSELLDRATWRVGVDAARHLFRVAAGLESPIPGDRQILSQLRRAVAGQRPGGTLGPALTRLLDTALGSGRRARDGFRQAGLDSAVGIRAAEVARAELGDLAGRRCLVVGAGEVGRDAARHLAALGADDLVILNRTAERAEALARSVSGRFGPLDRLADEAAVAEVVVLAASAPGLLTAGALGATRLALGDPARLLVLDLAVPRAAEADVGQLPGVELFTVDRLRQVAPLPAEAVRGVAEVVEHDVARFAEWLAAARARSAIQPLHLALTRVCERELAYLAGPEAGERVASRIAGKLLAEPMRVLSGALARGESVESATLTLRALFPAATTR